MSSTAKIRVRVPSAEVEIEAPLQELKEIIALLPELMAQLPVNAVQSSPPKETVQAEQKHEQANSETMPTISLEKSDSLSDIIAKIFREPWGRKPRKLNHVREVLESYGLIYPKQSVAVTLLRLAQSGKLRRFKDDSGEFVYTASTSLSSPQGTLQPEPSLGVQLGA
ncbi:MAG: hypothetical protein HYU02_08270 [Thaumarchaeota archaeon]|nr:hypothetical protein [Nitrososphaerota archaeon]